MSIWLSYIIGGWIGYKYNLELLPTLILDDSYYFFRNNFYVHVLKNKYISTSRFSMDCDWTDFEPSFCDSWQGSVQLLTYLIMPPDYYVVSRMS
jgi:hypothetical protein